MSLIRRNGVWPPGGFAFTDPRTGLKLDGMSVTFEEQVQRIIKHRSANKEKYPPDEDYGKRLHTTIVADELDSFTCLRIGNNINFCVPANGQHPGVPKTIGKFCEACGGALAERLCSTCSGRRVIGHVCSKCGKET